MGRMFLWAMIFMVLSCSSEHSGLERIYGVDRLDGGVESKSVDIGLMERGRKGVDYFRGDSKVYLYSDRIGFELGRVFRKKFVVSSSAVDACVMTCFGNQDEYLGMVISKANSFIEMSYSDDVARWCFNNNIDAISSLQKRRWLYSGDGALDIDVGKSVITDFDGYKSS